LNTSSGALLETAWKTLHLFLWLRHCSYTLVSQSQPLRILKLIKQLGSAGEQGTLEDGQFPVPKKRK